MSENPYDDPYLMLAYHIVAHYPDSVLKRAVYEDEWLRARVQEDCMALDLAGPFLDVIVEHLDEHNRLWLRGRLKELGAELFTQLDVPRLRKRILQIIAVSSLQ